MIFLRKRVPNFIHVSKIYKLLFFLHQNIPFLLTEHLIHYFYFFSNPLLSVFASIVGIIFFVDKYLNFVGVCIEQPFWPCAQLGRGDNKHWCQIGYNYYDVPWASWQNYCWLVSEPWVYAPSCRKVHHDSAQTGLSSSIILQHAACCSHVSGKYSFY